MAAHSPPETSLAASAHSLWNRSPPFKVVFLLRLKPHGLCHGRLSKERAPL